MPTFGSTFLPVLAVIILTGGYGVHCAEELVCAFKDTEYGPDDQGTPDRPIIINTLTKDDAEMGSLLPDNRSIQCAGKPNYCFAVVIIQVNEQGEQETNIITQGCWNNQKQKDCSQEYCAPSLIGVDTLNNTYFCCCQGDMCNSNFSSPRITKSTTTVADYIAVEVDPNYKRKTIIIALTSVMSVAVVTVLTYLVIRMCCQADKEPPSLDSAHLVESPPSPSYELDSLKLCKLIHNSRFGEIWKGTLNDFDVAVKVFSPSQRQYYLSERDIYTLPHMECTALPRFYGSEERLTVEGLMQYVIVMNYIKHGSLTSYLKNNTVDWSTLCKMCHSISSGLGHLHTDVYKGDQVKPAVAHRDLNSRNILVRDDLSCTLCDFGFAIKISGSHFIRNGQEENAEHTSLSDVGTVRYMAPEVLEGAVNLRDCEASLKQIDVYALGLVFWEIGARCNDLYQGLPVPEYLLPFQERVGTHPSFKDMQQLVCRDKFRPIFPDTWKDTNQAIHAFKETIEDCWDHDAEARLTALCVEERVLEMATLWDTRHKGLTPTVLASGFLGELEDKAQVQRNPTMNQSSQPTQPVTEFISPPPNASISRGTSGDCGGSRVSLPPVSNRLSQSEFSGGSTVETIMSPSEPGTSVLMETVPTNKTNLNMVNAKANKPLQPHQGQNPTVARNTHKRSDEELAIIGNTLVDKAAMKSGAELKPADKVRGLSNVALADELLDVLADNLESSLVQNDMLNQQQLQQQQQQQHHHHHHPNQHHSHSAPIPYLQNHVHNSLPNVVRPKQPNVPGNGSAHSDITCPAVTQPKKKNKADSSSKPGGFMRSLFGRNFLSKGKGPKEEPGVTEPLTHEATRPQNLNYSSVAQTGKSNLNAPVAPLSSEVRLVNGQPVVRPANLPLLASSGQQSQGYNLDAVNTAVPNTSRLGVAEVGVAKLEQTVPTLGQPAMVHVKNKSHSSIDLSPNGGWSSNFADSDVDNDLRARRPCSLSLTGHNYNSASAGSLPHIVKGSLDKLRKGSRRDGRDPHQQTNVQMELLQQNPQNYSAGGSTNVVVKPPNVDLMLRECKVEDGSTLAKRAGRSSDNEISLHELGNGNGEIQHQPQQPHQHQHGQAADCRC